MPRKQSANDGYLDDLNLDDLGLDDLDLSDLDIPELAGVKKEPAADDPFKEIKYTGNASTDSKAELTAIGQAFKERALTDKKRQELATDSEYWFCVCFLTREQCEEFLEKAGLSIKDKYIDGRVMAKALGMTINSPDPEFSKAKIDRTWIEEFESIG
jgi:hypothetical protein